jgi:hypothetical protein
MEYGHLYANWKIKVSKTQFLLQATGEYHDKLRIHQFRRRKIVMVNCSNVVL